MKRSRLWSGGKHQRLQRARVDHVGPLPAAGSASGPRLGPLDGDPEVDVLIELWSLGVLSAKTLRTIATAAVKVAPRPAMCELASLSEGHFHRDLSRKLKLGSNDIPVPIQVPLPLRDENAKPAKLVEGRSYPVLLPHEVIANMYEAHPEEFKNHVLGLAPLSEFWSHVGDLDPRHPLTRIENFRECVVPLRIHGDGVPVAKRRGRSLDAISWSSIVGIKGAPSWDSKFLIFAMVDAAKIQGCRCIDFYHGQGVAGHSVVFPSSDLRSVAG